MTSERIADMVCSALFRKKSPVAVLVLARSLTSLKAPRTEAQITQLRRAVKQVVQALATSTDDEVTMQWATALGTLAYA